MKAAVLENIQSLKITDLPIPKCSKEEILIKVKNCAICGTDVKVYYHGHRLINFPRVTGHEVSGEIIEKGLDVINFEIGNKVTVAPAIPCGECDYCRWGMMSMCDHLTAIGYHYDGGFAELMLVPSLAIKNGCVNFIPEGVSFEEAALAEPLACAINAQELSGVKLGDTVVILGAGSLGYLHTQLAKTKGAAQIILADISTTRLKMLKKSGANYYIDISSNDLKKRVMEITSGKGAQIVIVACSSGKAQEDALQIVAKRGNVNFFGGLPKDNSIIKFDSNLLHYREFYVVGTHGSAPYHNKLALTLIKQGLIKVKDLITHHLPLENLFQGLQMVEKGEGLKVMIEMNK